MIARLGPLLLLAYALLWTVLLFGVVAYLLTPLTRGLGGVG